MEQLREDPGSGHKKNWEEREENALLHYGGLGQKRQSALPSSLGPLSDTDLHNSLNVTPKMGPQGHCAKLGLGFTNGVRRFE